MWNGSTLSETIRPGIHSTMLLAVPLRKGGTRSKNASCTATLMPNPSSIARRTASGRSSRLRYVSVAPTSSKTKFSPSIRMLPVPVVPVELNAYQRKENWGASETFYRIARACCGQQAEKVADSKPSCNVLGPTALGFRHRDDLLEITRLLGRLGIDINVVAPLDASPSDLARLPAADFNVVLYPEIAETTAQNIRAFLAGKRNEELANVVRLPDA